MIQPIQIVLIPFLFFAISRVYLRAREGTLTPGAGMFWISLFFAAIVGIIDPNFTNYLANQFGIGRGADLVVYFSLVLLFYLIFRTNVMIEDTHHEITKLIQQLALQDTQSTKPGKPSRGKKK